MILYNIKFSVNITTTHNTKKQQNRTNQNRTTRALIEEQNTGKNACTKLAACIEEGVDKKYLSLLIHIYYMNYL